MVAAAEEPFHRTCASKNARIVECGELLEIAVSTSCCSPFLSAASLARRVSRCLVSTPAAAAWMSPLGDAKLSAAGSLRRTVLPSRRSRMRFITARACALSAAASVSTMSSDDIDATALMSAAVDDDDDDDDEAEEEEEEPPVARERRRRGAAAGALRLEERRVNAAGGAQRRAPAAVCRHRAAGPRPPQVHVVAVVAVVIPPFAFGESASFVAVIIWGFCMGK